MQPFPVDFYSGRQPAQYLHNCVEQDMVNLQSMRSQYIVKLDMTQVKGGLFQQSHGLILGDLAGINDQVKG